ncbi:MAG: DUF7694 domain-containing protein, partial [bacterium]
MSKFEQYMLNSAWRWIAQTPEFKDTWIPGGTFGPYGLWFRHKHTPLKVFITVPRGKEDCPPHWNGEMWVHVSASREDGLLPNYTEMAMVKRMFIGAERTAYSVWAKDSAHINIK